LLQISPSSASSCLFAATLVRDIFFIAFEGAVVSLSKLRILVLCAGLGSLAAGLVHAQIVNSSGIIVPTLKQQLSAGLLARTPAEQAFVELVVSKVNSGDLPLSLVQSTFLWARRHQPYPMPYFERALRLRAKDLGISF
jgi:hypothetical protein